MNELILQGRSSSHFTRTARMFAIELGVPHDFRAVLDLTSRDAAHYAGNPALKIPILIDASGPLLGTENICRELVRRSGKAASVVMRGDTSARLIANAEEPVLHVMSAEISLILARMTGDGSPPPAKVVRSIESNLGYLDDNVVELLALLPADRALSFVEVSLFCVVTHLPCRQVMNVAPWQRLGDFCNRYAERASARATEYRFDAV